ncbi:MAG: hypothetical protein FJZ00_00225 [Candidatus Sericytochromatia bacterium]|uniref:Uncharacterized protein n=1 Tax=Candidatus Tanganyikabacteria bacterium TaxID=2961651 RepID=A0A938BJU5_9BACT|nr:hypothetical protein [Candidatus Tanganyikabacteria bacterium]
MITAKTAYEAGVKAQKMGFSRNANPYSPWDFFNYNAWFAGWMDARDQGRRRVGKA